MTDYLQIHDELEEYLEQAKIDGYRNYIQLLDKQMIGNCCGGESTYKEITVALHAAEALVYVLSHFRDEVKTQTEE